mgnify:CR=1 FL=1
MRVPKIRYVSLLQLRKHVDVKTLEREAARLRRAAAAGASSSDTPAAASASSSASAGDDAVLLRYFNDPASQALLQWVRAACALHGVGVDNFTWSLADGRALCYLVSGWEHRGIRAGGCYVGPGC